MIPKAGHVLSLKCDDRCFAANCAGVEEVSGGYLFTVILPEDFFAETGRHFAAGERYSLAQFNMETVAEVHSVVQDDGVVGVVFWLQSTSG